MARRSPPLSASVERHGLWDTPCKSKVLMSKMLCAAVLQRSSKAACYQVWYDVRQEALPPSALRMGNIPTHQGTRCAPS